MKIFQPSLSVLRVLPLAVLLHSSSKHTNVNAMFPDEAGQNDFTISSAGHGQFGVTYAQLSSDKISILTSSSSSPSTSSSSMSSSNNHPRVDANAMKGCYLSSRSLEDGSLNWRRNVCSTSTAAATATATTTTNDPSIRHAVYSSENNNFVFTLDDFGMLRKWDDTDGNMIQQIKIDVDVNVDGTELTSSSSSSSSPFLIPISDTVLGCVMGGENAILVNMEDMKIVDDKPMSTKAILKKATNNDNNDNLQCNDMSIRISSDDNKLDVLDTSTAESTSVLASSELGFDETSETKFVKMLHCDDKTGTTMIALITSTTGSTAVFKIHKNGNGTSQVIIDTKWVAEEAFGSVSSTTFLDWSSTTTTTGGTTGDDDNLNNDDGEDAILASLSFTSRLTSQFESLVSFVQGGFKEHIMNVLHNSGTNNDSSSSSDNNGKDIIFGLKKVAVMLSIPFSKVFGIDTSSDGNIIWSMSLNSHAMWHKVVHGTSTSRSSVFGHGMHHPHSTEILVLSQLSDAIEWRCVDGLKGRVISKSQISLSNPVVQILPIHAHSHAGGGCKQNALLILEDNTYVVVPNTPQSIAEASKVIDMGLYSHKIDKEAGLFTTMKIAKDSNQAMVIGETLFDPSMEKIVNVAYPQRNEVVQSPSTILGDDSLLLKYLNPHLCVVVTEATADLMQHQKEEEDNTFYNALSSSKNGGGRKGKKKPVGVTKPGEEAPSVVKTASPTLFINIVDTVSGQILHRASHAHAAPGSTLADDANVPVVISENWIVYTFPNARTRRTELGVITLHEGMIDKHGITAFSTPEQQESFSSLTSSKPIALTKTYALSVPVSAIGVTNTKNGISSKNILLATGAKGQVIRIDRRLLDPRRPSGEPKDTEKKEGLMQYVPFLPTPPMMVQSYTNNIEDVSSIQSTAANLESQTLVIAYGGPDVFFTRYAPSKGFDLLPESFNKFAIIMVLVALFVVLDTLKKLSQKKFVKLGWS